MLSELWRCRSRGWQAAGRHEELAENRDLQLQVLTRPRSFTSSLSESEKQKPSNM